jgi:uncharacterized protein YoxC
MDSNEKQKYINENIIEKGYNPEDLSNFVTRHLGVNIDSLDLEKLKEMVNSFKNEQLKNTYSSVKVKKEKKLTLNEILYTPEKYSIQTNTQQECKLLDFEKEKKKLTIVISEPKKEAKNFFSQKIYSFLITCEELETKVRRTFTDFEWFKNQLNQRYPFILVPPIQKENLLNNVYNNYINLIGKKDNQVDNELLNLKMRYLTQFMNSLLRKKILRTSPLVLEFLRLPESDFKKYKDYLNKNPFNVSITLSNLKTIKGHIDVELNENNLNKANLLYKNLQPSIQAFNKINSAIVNVANDMKNLTNHMKEIGEAFTGLIEQNELKHIELDEEVVKIFKNLKNTFDTWSVSYKSQCEFFNNDFREFFDYMNLELSEMKLINDLYEKAKSEYEFDGINLNKKKEDLWNKKNYDKWELLPEDNEKLGAFQNDKKQAFEKMCYNESRVVKYEKRKIAFIVNKYLDEYRKLNKYHGERIRNYFEKIKEINNVMVGDAFNLIKLLSIEP